MLLNSLPNEKILDMTKVKASEDNKLNVAKMIISLCYRVENTVGKEENAGYQHFLLFPQCFPKPISLGSLKVWIFKGQKFCIHQIESIYRLQIEC